VHPPADLSPLPRYHTVSHSQLWLGQEIDVEDISPFNTFLTARTNIPPPPPLSPPLTLSPPPPPLPLCAPIHARVFLFFSLCAQRHGKGLMPCSRGLLARDFTRPVAIHLRRFSFLFPRAFPRTLCHGRCLPVSNAQVPPLPRRNILFTRALRSAD
jgi:hypothetical protein